VARGQPFPFGLDSPDAGQGDDAVNLTMEDDLDALDPTLARRKARRGDPKKEEAAPANPKGARHTFSDLVPNLLRSIHARCVLLAWAAKGQLDMAPQSEGWPSATLDFASRALAGYCAAVEEQFASADITDTYQISQAVQVAANMQALRSCAREFLTVVCRGLVASNVVRTGKATDALLGKLEATVATVQRACDRAEGAARDGAFSIARAKIDQLMSFSVDTALWCEKKARDEADEFVDVLVNFLRVTFGNVNVFKKVRASEAIERAGGRAGGRSERASEGSGRAKGAGERRERASEGSGRAKGAGERASEASARQRIC
jgi:hypothetical protein